MFSVPAARSTLRARWLRSLICSRRSFSESDIGFPETRAYVERVFGAERDYRSVHGRELGITPRG